MKSVFILSLPFLFSTLFTSCKTIPDGVKAVDHFEVKRYLGKWYEIARIDFRFEEGLNNTTATYSLNEDGSVKVDNKGYDYAKNEWKQSIGKAKFVDDTTVAMLKVSFFGPFYGGYNVLALDSDYQYALVGGDSFDYLWILARQPQIPEAIKTDYLKIAKDFGYHTDELVWIEHTNQLD